MLNTTDTLVRELLVELASLLEQNAGQVMASKVAAIACASEAELIAFLCSNELWGGSGSIADEAGVGPQRTELRRRIEATLINLGTEQIKAGIVNVRTASWVVIFQTWSTRDI